MKISQKRIAITLLLLPFSAITKESNNAFHEREKRAAITSIEDSTKASVYKGYIPDGSSPVPEDAK
jgi:hypothetical protein